MNTIARLDKTALAVLGKLARVVGSSQHAASADMPAIPDGGTPIDLAKLSLPPKQRLLLAEKIPVGERSGPFRGLLLKLMQADHSDADILATLLKNEALWQYLMSKRNDDPDRAVQLARDEIRRARAEAQKSSPDNLVKLRNQLLGTPVTGTTEAIANGTELVAQHLCTDQANAERLQKSIGAGVMFSAGRWYVWLGTHWGSDEPAAFMLTCNLSLLIKLEAEEWDHKAHASAEEQKRNKDIASNLRKWGAKSEMLDRLNAAFNLLKRLVSVPADSLDRDPYSLNVANGTIDLRTGKLRPHDRADLITRCIYIDYDPKAEASTFKRVLAEIAGGSKPLADFLQRWFGYCANGVTSEQKFAVHHGDGANGKSLLLDTISSVLGPYAGTAAPNLLMAGGQNRHPAEIADLFGMRLVVAHESGESGVLREDLIKQATGGDKLKARFMRQDFFEFSPTHTLNLLTNHKPQIRGQDMGIWRRVMLVPYGVTFGTKGEVEQGTAHFVRDDRLGEALKAEYAGILTWLVQGAAKWYVLGLNPPDIVLSAGAEYRSEQDRIGEFLTERTDRDPEFRVPCDALYKHYHEWCKESGYCSLGKKNFIAAVAKHPGIEKQERVFCDYMGKKRQLACFFGIDHAGVRH